METCNSFDTDYWIWRYSIPSCHHFQTLFDVLWEAECRTGFLVVLIIILLSIWSETTLGPMNCWVFVFGGLKGNAAKQLHRLLIIFVNQPSYVFFNNPKNPFSNLLLGSRNLEMRMRKNPQLTLILTPWTMTSTLNFTLLSLSPRLCKSLKMQV